MIRIRNVTKGRPDETQVAWTTKPTGTSGEPVLFDIAPGAHVDIQQDTLSNYHPGVKQRMAEFMAHNIITVEELVTVHRYQDKGDASQYPISHLVDATFTQALDNAIEVATDLDRVLTAHFGNLSVHNAAVGAIGVALPTNLATLNAWITAAAAAHLAHRTSVGAAPNAHPVLDATNVVAAFVPGTLAVAITALRDLYRKYHSHKEWLQGPTVPISALAILTY